MELLGATLGSASPVGLAWPIISLAVPPAGEPGSRAADVRTVSVAATGPQAAVPAPPVPSAAGAGAGDIRSVDDLAARRRAGCSRTAVRAAAGQRRRCSPLHSDPPVASTAGAVPPIAGLALVTCAWLPPRRSPRHVCGNAGARAACRDAAFTAVPPMIGLSR